MLPDLIPSPYRLYAMLLGAVLLLAIGAAGGALVNGWRLTTGFNAERLASAKETLRQTEAALRNYQDNINKGHLAALAAAKTGQQLDAGFDRLTQEYRRHALFNPRPADCRIDAERVRYLSELRDRANRAAAGEPIE